jgi:hypothetical protein
LSQHTENRHVLVIDLSRAANPDALRDKRSSAKVAEDPTDDVRRLVAHWRKSRTPSRLPQGSRHRVAATVVDPAQLGAHVDHLLRAAKKPEREATQTDAIAAARHLLDLLEREDNEATATVRAALKELLKDG